MTSTEERHALECWRCAECEAERAALLEALDGIDLSDDAALDGVPDDELVNCRRPAWVWREARAAIRQAKGEDDANAQ